MTASISATKVENSSNVRTELTTTLEMWYFAAFPAASQIPPQWGLNDGMNFQLISFDDEKLESGFWRLKSNEGEMT